MKDFIKLEGWGIWRLTLPTGLDDVVDYVYVIAQNEAQIKKFIEAEYPDGRWFMKGYEGQLKRLDCDFLPLEHIWIKRSELLKK